MWLTRDDDGSDAGAERVSLFVANVAAREVAASACSGANNDGACKNEINK